MTGSTFLQGDTPLLQPGRGVSCQTATRPTAPSPPLPVRQPTARAHGEPRIEPLAIIGAGPYALSIGAHLRARGMGFRIFGKPMESWRTRMAAGMLLKSEGFASDLYDEQRSITLKRFCAEKGLPYADTGLPIPVEVMAAYGLHFQERLLPDLENQTVVAVERSGKEFSLQLENGETLMARRVIVAVGGCYFQYVPPALAHLPREFVSHSSEHSDLRRFAGRDVTVVGSGSSALDLAALLHEAGAQVRLVARRSSLVYLDKPGPRSLWHRMHYPMSGIGGGWKSCFFTTAPMLYRYLPQQIRLQTLKTYLGPAGGWFIKDRIEGHVPVLLACTPALAKVKDGRVSLQCDGNSAHELITDHVIAATGYQIDAGRLSFLSEKIRAELRCVERAPVLSPNFESSIPGLYFVGLASAPWFGPVMRFMYGAGYTARRLSQHIGSIEAG